MIFQKTGIPIATYEMEELMEQIAKGAKNQEKTPRKGEQAINYQ